MKILMTLMGLEIGGAETHVVELAKELARRGNEIVIVSNGGVFEKEIADAGIAHFSLPLHSKKLKNFVKSYKGLKKIIKEGKFDLVHAHARIPAFICGLLQRKLKFRFITTTHWVFKTGIFLNIMTNWGERTIAVSNDIKKYLIDNYRLPAKHISVTINGIDTERFSSNIDYNDVAEEFNMGADKKRIVYVSRMDMDRSGVAFNLLEITPSLCKRYPDLEVVIVGGGNDYERLLAKSKAVNSEIGKRVVITTGSRVDINKFIASGDLFIGVSRAALEAMAAEKPVIIAGNEGYIGVFSQDKLDVSVQTNFCCRGCDMPTNQKLFDDVTFILDSFKEKRQQMGRYNRQVIIDNYSLIKMADDCVAAYENLISFNPFRPKDVIISGYYGYKNIGDDSLLEAIITNLREQKPDISITVLSAKPNETKNIYSVESIHRFNIFKIISEMKKTKLLISGGGSLVQDVTSTKSLYYYVSVIRLALQYGMKTFVYANGIGPINNKKNQKLCTEILNNVDVITLRDNNSKQELDSLNITKPVIRVTADPAFSLIPADEEKLKIIKRCENISQDKKYFIVSLRDWKTKDANFEKTIAMFCKYISQKYDLIPLFVPMQSSHDLHITKKTAELITTEETQSVSTHRFNKVIGRDYKILKDAYNAKDLLAIISQCEFAIGMRLHFLIYSASVGVPVMGISYDPKIDAMLDYCRQSYKHSVSDISIEKLKYDADEIMCNKNTIRNQLSAVSRQMCEMTKTDAAAAIEML